MYLTACWLVRNIHFKYMTHFFYRWQIEKPMSKDDSRESMKTTKSMKQKSRAITRCIISMMKIFRLCTKKKKKREEWFNKILKNTTHGSGVFLSPEFGGLGFLLGRSFAAPAFLSRFILRSSFFFSVGQVVLASFIASRCETGSFDLRDIRFLVLATYKNHSCLNDVIVILNRGPLFK